MARNRSKKRASLLDTALTVLGATVVRCEVRLHPVDSSFMQSCYWVVMNINYMPSCLAHVRMQQDKECFLSSLGSEAVQTCPVPSTAESAELSKHCPP